MPSLALKLLLKIAVSDSLPLEKSERRKTKQSDLGFLDVIIRCSHSNRSIHSSTMYRPIAMRAAYLAQGQPAGKLLRVHWHKAYRAQLQGTGARLNDWRDMSGIDQDLQSCFQTRQPATPSTCGQTPTMQDA